MEIGKVPENILERSVFRQIHHRRPEVVLHPGVGEDCGGVEVPPGEVLVLSVDPITAADKGMGTFAVHVTANDLASSGAEPVGVLLSILLPPGKREKYLRELMEEIEQACLGLNIEVMGGHTEVTSAVNQPVVTVTGVGRVEKERLIATGGLRAGDELVMTKWAGMEGTAIIAEERREKLLETLPAELVEQAAGMLDYISVVPEAKVARNAGATAMHDVTEGGIFGALWEIGAAADVGIQAELAKIPIRQETIEVCEAFELNPYRMMSSGSLLIGCENGNRMVEELEKEGIAAAVIGRATDSHDRVIVSGEEIRFLEPPGSDELYKIYGKPQC